MDRNRVLIVVLMALLLYSGIAQSFIYRLIHDLVQNNLAGKPSFHQETEWNFNPEFGKLRRARYEQENGRYGEHTIAKLGMGMEYDDPFGKPVNH